MNDWTELLLTYDEVEAHIVKDVLESANIQVAVDSLKITPYPVSVGRIGEVRVMVLKEDEDRARELLKDYEWKPVESDDS